MSHSCACTKAYSQLLLLLMGGTDATASSVLAATPLLVPPPTRGEGTLGRWRSQHQACSSIAFTLSRRCHLDRAGGGPTKTVGPVHVLHIGLRMHIAAGRDRAHHVSHREHRTVGALAIERSGKAIITELGIGRLDRVLDPTECAGLTRRHQPRIVDLEAG